MTNNKVKYIKPEEMTQQLPDYERKKREKMELNHMRMVELGYQKMADALFPAMEEKLTHLRSPPSSSLPLRETRSLPTQVESNEMRPPTLGSSQAETEPETESSNPVIGQVEYNSEGDEVEGKMTNNKVKYIKPGEMAQQVPDYERKKREKMELNHMRMVELGYQKMADALFGSNKKRKIKNTKEAKNMRAQASTSRRVRGANHGINIERLIAGGSGKKLDVEIPLEVGAPIGENATRFATWLGIQIRMAAPLKNVEKWDDITFYVKVPIIQATRDKFNVVGYDEKEHVRRGVNRKCKKLYRTWRRNMKDNYEALVEAGKDPYVNPYK
ncbi:hypothetical protein RHSIM_Rhsim04G0116500 [Rhododendron simsii]|uniref:Uncharacterized protein n=1 Tax=Rhododendron simsii TaxID=118357 RepID=A0A834H1E2_RHOSS|nr:hypothetical protein RHSIM_Rhsim04G0116500 [Rhododendron simsii]